MRKRWNLILPFVVLAIVAVIVYIKRDDLDAFVQTVQAVQALPFAAAALCLFGRYFSHAFAYKGVFRCVDEEVPYMHIVPLVFSVTFANDCAPTAGTAGSVLIAAWSHKQGLDMGKSVTVVFLEKIGYFGGFAVVMLVGFAILLFTGQMTPILALGGLAVVLMIATFAFVLILGYNRVETEKQLFKWVEEKVNKLLVRFKREPMESWHDRTAASFHEASLIAVQKPKTIASTFARFVMAHAFDCLCFIFVGFAFNFTYIPYLIASYVAGFIIATFILQTIGAVEVLIGLILAAYGAGGAAAAIALAYRGLIFWVPFIIGAICINITGSQKEVLVSSPEGTILQEGAEVNLERVEEEHTAMVIPLEDVVARAKTGEFKIPQQAGWPMRQEEFEEAAREAQELESATSIVGKLKKNKKKEGD